ncbi:InlB B-repeat-containing protein [Anaerocolumna sp. MB42-C2]|uniref:InlB B-repeat-containing protein n=1 Tax=Anaerocolumna sp. MB42-C2 TaxID=3070997 RepID=UPI0027E0EEAC|nr:InlB B-repeat-containing protein [Anaerocolumna sp. MB42-C2]WMJ86343.1 InlB B-repeat-containing protein [Anaerocolumna sp. MB42-C2]
MNMKNRRLFCFALGILLITLALPQKMNAATASKNGGGKTFTVTFNPKGGAASLNSMEVTFGDTYGGLPTATRDHYTFLGWYTYAYGGVKITKDSTVKINGSHTLYAHWSGKKYTISLDANGGLVKKETVNVYYGTKYSSQLPEPARANYVFDGWYTAKTGGDKITSESVYDENAKKKLYARWVEKKLEITFIAYNGEEYEQEVICGKKYGKLPAPKRDGCKFAGWYSWDNYTEADGKPVMESDIVKESDPLKLFARWY